jgi:hypothetical protein
MKYNLNSPNIYDIDLVEIRGNEKTLKKVLNFSLSMTMGRKCAQSGW